MSEIKENIFNTSGRACHNCKYFDTEESEHHQPDTKWCVNPIVQKGADCRKAEISWAWINYCHGDLFEYAATDKPNGAARL